MQGVLRTGPTGYGKIAVICIGCPIVPPKKTPESEAEAAVVGRRLREHREDLGLSQSQLAERLFSRTGKRQSGSKVSQWERGESIPERSKRPEIADALQTTPLALFGETDDPEVFKRLAIVEQQVKAIIHLEGLGDAVERELRKARQAARREAGD